MRRSRWAIIPVLIATSISIAPARANHTGPAPVDRSAVPVLAGENTIFGHKTAWTRVRLPEAWHWGEFMDSKARVKGDGRLLGIFMFQERNGEVDHEGAQFSIWRAGNCGTHGCERNGFSFPGMNWDLDKNDMLPAGVYRLYLVVDGAPGSISFEIPRLSGATRINPDRAMGTARAKVETLRTRLQVPVTGTAFAAGNERPFDGKGITLQEQWIDPIGAGVADVGACWYRREAPADHDTAYLPPNCNVTPLPSVFFIQRYTPLNDCCLGFSMALPFLPKAMGSWYVSSGPVESAGAVALWLTP